jgi:hypothetical protein
MNLKNLFFLDLGENDLTGTLPDDWVNGNNNMYMIRNLYLSSNKLGGALPTNFGSIGNSRLEMLLLNDNLFTGTMPSGYNPRSLNVLEFENNKFSFMDTNICSENIVFEGGEMVFMGSDCNVCRCRYFCGKGECFN